MEEVRVEKTIHTRSTPTTMMMEWSSPPQKSTGECSESYLPLSSLYLYVWSTRVTSSPFIYCVHLYIVDVKVDLENSIVHVLVRCTLFCKLLVFIVRANLPECWIFLKLKRLIRMLKLKNFLQWFWLSCGQKENIKRKI